MSAQKEHSFLSVINTEIRMADSLVFPDYLP